MLSVANNQLTELPPKIGQLTALQRLDLSGNQLTALGPEIGQLTALQHLDLGGNQLTSVPPELLQLTALQHLDLRGNQLTSLPTEIGRLTALRHLFLQKNQLTALPREIGQLTALETLSLSGNRLIMLPPEMVELTALHSLHLGANQLTEMFPEIAKLTSLYSLDLSGNRLTALPREIESLSGLLILDLGGNRLTGLPIEVGQLADLHRLDLKNNQLRVLPPEIGQLRRLFGLDLRNNLLTELPTELGYLLSLEDAAEEDDEPYTYGLFLDENPLPHPYSILIATGQPSATANVLRWLRNELNPAVPEIPPQGYGPHFEVGDDGIITFAPPDALDREGNNVARLKKLHPSLRSLSFEIVEALGKGNIPHRHLRDRADAYRALIEQDLECIDFALLYVEGVRLANAERAAGGDKELPPLDPPVREAIDTLLQVHGTFMLASAEGLEIIAAEERYQRTPQEEIEYRTAAVGFARSLQNEPKVIDQQAASFVLGAAEEIGKGVNLERSGAVATGTIRNVAITAATAAALAAISVGAVATASPAAIVGAGATVLVVGEGLKKSRPFAAVAALVTKGLDKASETEIVAMLKNLSDRFRSQLRFVLKVEPQVRRLAGQRPEFRWLTRSLDWIKQQMPQD
jgi:hypothetical protein